MENYIAIAVVLLVVGFIYYRSKKSKAPGGDRPKRPGDDNTPQR